MPRRRKHPLPVSLRTKGDTNAIAVNHWHVSLVRCLDYFYRFQLTVKRRSASRAKYFILIRPSPCLSTYQFPYTASSVRILTLSCRTSCAPSSTPGYLVDVEGTHADSAFPRLHSSFFIHECRCRAPHSLLLRLV